MVFQILSSSVTFAAVVLPFLDTVLFNVWWSLSLSFGFQPLLLLADDVFSHVITTFGTAALDTSDEMAIWLQMLKLNTHRQSVYFANLISFPFCSTFIHTVTTICYALTLALHILNKQKISKDTCNWCSVSAANTDCVVPIVSSVSIILSIPFMWSEECPINNGDMAEFLNHLKQSVNHKRKRWSYVTLKLFSNTYSYIIIWCKFYQVICIIVLATELIIYIPAECENKVDI